VLASAECTNQEAWLLQRLAREVIGTEHIDHQLAPFAGIGPEEHALGIADIEECSAVVVLGPAPEREAPVLRLRLYKAERKRGVAVHRIGPEVAAPEIARRIRDQRRVGVIVDETERGRGAEVATALDAWNQLVERLTVTRGINGRGAKDLGLLPGFLPGYRPAPGAGKSGREILDAAAAGQLQALLLLNAQSTLAAVPELAERALRGVEVVIAIETTPGVVAGAATVLIPGHSTVEKAGSVTNLEGRVQRIRQALPPASATPPETRILAMLAADLGTPGWPGEVTAVNRALLEAVSAYAEAGNGGRARVGVPVP
jgi:NADH-quinone oxidoreductase subunit G